MSRQWAVSGLSLESLSQLTLDSFSLDPFDPSAPPHGEANPSGLRSDSEIAAFAIDESLDELQRAMALVSSPHVVQRHSLLFQLPTLLSVHPEQCGVLLPLVAPLMSELNEEQLSQLTDVYQQLMDARILTLQHAKAILVPRMLAFLSPAELAQLTTPSSGSPASTSSTALLGAATSGSPASALRGACVDVLASVLRHFTEDSELVSTLSSFASLSAESIHSSSRLVAALLFAKLAGHMPQASLLPLLPAALALCQDTAMDVRTAMCSALAPMAATLASSGPGGLESLSSELSELLRDEELTVQQAALLSLSPLLLPNVMGVLRSYFGAPPKGLHEVLARVYGEVLVAVKPAGVGGGSEGLRVMRDFYKASSSGVDGEIRYWCAYNLPALFTLVSSQSPSSSPPLFDVSFLCPLLTAFSHDPHPPVRISLSHSLAVLAPLLLSLSPAHFRVLKELILTLLKDANPVVRDNVLTHSPQLLAAASSCASSALDACALSEVFRGLLGMEGLGLSYRVRMLHLASLFALRVHFTGHELQYQFYDRLSPLLFSCLHSSPPAPLLELLVQVLNHFLCSLPSTQRRTDLLQRLLRECGPTSRSCYDRLLFLALVESWLSVFSRRWLRKHVVSLLIKMAASEGVREVKVKLLAVLGRVERAKALDAKEKELWSKALLAYCNDADRFVSERAKDWVKRRATEERGTVDEDDERDREKEEREERMVKDEEDALELMMRKEQLRERNVLLSGGAGASNSAVMLMIIKHKKERDRRGAATDEEKSSSAPSLPHPSSSVLARTSSSSSLTAPLLSPLTPSAAGKEDRKLATRVSSHSPSTSGRPRNVLDKSTSDSGDGDDGHKRERGRGRSGHLPGLSAPPSLYSTASPPASTSITPTRSPVSASSSSPTKKPASSTVLAAPSMHPMSRRYPSMSASSTAAPSAAASTAGLVIPSLGSSSPRVAKAPLSSTATSKHKTGAGAAGGVSLGLSGSAAMLKIRL